MWSYAPPLRDMQFVIEEVLDAADFWRGVQAFEHLDVDTSRQVLEAAGKFATSVLAPVNGSADLEGCHWRDGEVSTPLGYREAYRSFIEGGWASLACSPEDGGQGLPGLLNAAFNEMIASANHAWTMYPGLLHGAYECLRAHGSAELKARYLAKLASGEWLATMNITEPQAGSDLSALRSKAEPLGDGLYSLTGSKIFISGGDHDLTENIVHLILARLPDAPVGTKGISLFLAPKLLPDGSRNNIRCDGIEKKMGLKGSATCTMTFDGATGWLIGEAHKGLASMFVMMNSARLHVGLQGLGHLEMAQRNAHVYAQERVQGRGQPIAAHPTVRRTLWSLRALVEGERVVAYWCAHLIDEAHYHTDIEVRKTAGALVGLLTPVVKAFFTDNGHRGADEALQLWGGYGYIHEYGIEQSVRDSRIAMIYEGTNEIQAIDLVQRKVLADGGIQFEAMLAVLEVETFGLSNELKPFSDGLLDQIVAARSAVTRLREVQLTDPEFPLRVADDFLRACGFMLLAWAWCRTARTAHKHLNKDPWYQTKLQTARFGIEWLLPESRWRWERIAQGTGELPPLA